MDDENNTIEDLRKIRDAKQVLLIERVNKLKELLAEPLTLDSLEAIEQGLDKIILW